MTVAIKIENVSKLYRLGTVGTGTISHDLNRWWHQIRGKEDPYAKIGQVNDRTKRATSDEKREASSDSSGTPSPLDSSNSPLRAGGPDYVWALKDINLEVAQGEILGIIGRNGAGKSTLLKLLSRVTAPTTGSIKTKGRIASLLEVGTGFHPDLTGRENIYMNGAILGMRRSEITRQLDEIVEFSGCAKYLDTPVKRYSSGMTVRLGFAVAAHLDCEILIVDEVLAVGDAQFQKRCMAKMQDVSHSGKTILFVSHNFESIRRLTTRAVLISQGSMAFDGSPDDAISAYVGQNLENADSCVSVRDLPRPFGGLERGLEFYDLSIEAGRLQNVWKTCCLAIQVQLKANSSCGRFVIGLTVYTQERLPVGSSFSDAIAPPGKDSTETYQLRTHFPLAPGKYHCAISISEHRYGGSYLHDSLAEVLPFELTHEVDSERRWNSSWGAVELPPLSLEFPCENDAPAHGVSYDQ